MLYENQTYLPLILLHAGKIDMRGDWNFSQLCSPFLRIYYVENGEAWVTMQGVEHRLKSGHLYLIPPFTRHSDRCTGAFTHFYIHVLDPTIQGQNIYEQNVFPFETEADTDTVRLLKRLMELNPDCKLRQSAPSTYDTKQGQNEAIQRFVRKEQRVQYETQAILMLLIARFYNRAVPQNAGNDDRLLRAQRYIRQHMERPLHLQEVADCAAMCTDSLIRLFKRKLGVTPMEYILNKRIERAQMLLLTQNTPVKEIAWQSGFANASHFTAQFKRATGLTPLEYRRRQPHL